MSFSGRLLLFQPVCCSEATYRRIFTVHVVLERNLFDVLSFKERQFVFRQGPRHLSFVLARFSASCNHEQRATGSNERGYAPYGFRPKIRRQHLKCVRFEYEAEVSTPVARNGEQVCNDIRHRRFWETCSALRKSLRIDPGHCFINRIKSLHRVWNLFNRGKCLIRF